MDIEIAEIFVHWLSGIGVAGSGTVFAAGRRAQILVDIDVNSAHGVHFGDGAIQKLVISGAIGTIKAESGHELSCGVFTAGSLTNKDAAVILHTYIDGE